VVVLLALKTLELRARRDAFVVFFWVFRTAEQLFFSQSLLIAFAMLLGCWACSPRWSTATCRWASRH
jgi:hypothetical protein